MPPFLAPPAFPGPAVPVPTKSVLSLPPPAPYLSSPRWTLSLPRFPPVSNRVADLRNVFFPAELPDFLQNPLLEASLFGQLLFDDPAG